MCKGLNISENKVKIALYGELADTFDAMLGEKKVE
jgi:hypothetical protein